DLEKTVRDAGKRAAKLLRIRSMHPEILHLVGKLMYRTSYTQNQWQHAIETAFLCSMMAENLGMNVEVARRSALIHDIGKVLWAETEAAGSHAVSGAKFATEHGEPPEIVHPVAAHHNDEPPSTALAHLVAAADALSGARPGARRETLESFSERVEALEAICQAFGEVQKAAIMSGGREVRIQVDPRAVDDLGAMELSEDLAARIEDELTYPGQIKITVMREIVSTAVARRGRGR
ncbi:MAG: HDIG domain-containing protein, partial [Myxococcales bacterium]|nr:HDIG domain-containing protein [Myxococcales bacterium]